MRVFLSFSSEINAAAENIANRLRADGHRVFYCTDEMRASAEHGFDRQISNAIRRCHLFVFLVTPRALTGYALNELNQALELRKLSQGRILPVQWDSSVNPRDLPAALKARHILTPQGEKIADIVKTAREAEHRLRRRGVGQFAAGVALFAVFLAFGGMAASTLGLLPKFQGELLACEHPSHPQAGFRQSKQHVSQTGWTRGGTSSACSNELNRLRATDATHRFTLSNWADDHIDRRSGAFNENVQYKYRCIITEEWDPIFETLVSPACPREALTAWDYLARMWGEALGGKD